MRYHGNVPPVKRGAGELISFFENGGAAEERGVGALLLKEVLGVGSEEGHIPLDQMMIRGSGFGNRTFYGEGPTFSETLHTRFGYPLVKDPVAGRHRHTRPEGHRYLPTAQELADARAHMLGTLMMSQQYGPETAQTAGKMLEWVSLGNRRHRAMDLRNNAVGADLLKKAGINATPQELAASVDAAIFAQLERLMMRSPEERKFASPETGPDLYFPRKDSGHFVPDH